MDILNLGISYQDEIIISANGEGCHHIVDEVYAVIVASADDESDNNVQKEAVIKVAKSTDPNTLLGTTVCEGVAVGKVKHLKVEMPDFESDFSNIENEKQQFNVTTKSVENSIQQRIDSETNDDNINIQKAHINLLTDDLWVQSVVKNIEANNSVTKAIKLALKEISDNLSKVDNKVIKQWVNDIYDIAMQLLLELTPESHKTNNTGLSEPVVIVAKDILPSVFSNLDKSNILAIITTEGSLTAHISIMARSYAIPMLVLTDQAVLETQDNQLVIVDTLSSQVNTKPTDEQIQQANDLMTKIENKSKEVNQFANQPALTTDEVAIKVFANITNNEEAKKAFESGADGIGLLRSEMLFMHKTSMPDSKQQQDYQAIVDSMGGLEVTIRTLDIGTDKGLDYYPLEKEENPALDIRGIRVSLQDDQLLYNQLKAMLSVNPISACKIMLPMISAIDEVVKVRGVIDKIYSELKLLNKPRLGAMIETPSAALLVPQLNKHIDFYSIGTNDLSQYVLSMDRNSPKLLKYIDGLHPAVIRMMQIATQAAAIDNKPVAVCGIYSGCSYITGYWR